MVLIRCQCGHVFRVSASQAGKGGDCPRCRRSIRLVANGLDPQADEVAACLVCTAGPHHVGRQFFIAGGGPILIGKSRDCTIPLIDPKVSRVHACLLSRAGTWRIEDRNSTNGLEVNGRRVEACDLRDGDHVVIGDCEFTFAAPQASSAPVRPGDERITSVEQIAARQDEALDDTRLDLQDKGLAALADGQVDPSASAPAPPPAPRAAPPTVSKDRQAAPSPVGGRICPSCRRSLAIDAKICVDCGVNLATGRTLLTSLDTGLDELYTRAESVARFISWIIPLGLFPIASEAFGARRPHVVRAIALITVLASLWFLAIVYTGSPQFESARNLMLWSGRFDAGLLAPGELPPGVPPQRVSPADVGLGSYRPHQLLTHALLHAGFLHLAGNLVFLLVFGSRVNALAGNVLTLLVYPLLAVFAGLFHVAASENGPYHPMLGASGAVMGLAGMYLVFCPLYKVHMVFWYRLGLLGRFQLALRIFAVRGFWVVLVYIGLDVLYTALRVGDEVAHWAHLGGFATGMALAVGLLMTRLVNARGGDLLSALLGRRAWGLVGRPGERAPAGSGDTKQQA